MSLHKKVPGADTPIGDSVPAAGANVAAQQLKLIDVSASRDGQYVQVLFVSHDGRTTTIRLESRVAKAFHAELGNTLGLLSSNPAVIGLHRLN